MDKDNIKSAWRDTNNSFEKDKNMMMSFEAIMNGKRSTALDRLQARYLRFVMLALCCVPCSFSFMLPNIIPDGNGKWITIAFGIYFLICAGMDLWLYHGIGTIDCLRMSVTEVIDKARFYRKRHLQFIMILLPIAFCVLGVMAYSMQNDPEVIYGMIIGGVVGLLIGSRQLFKFMKDYREVSTPDE